MAYLLQLFFSLGGCSLSFILVGLQIGCVMVSKERFLKTPVLKLFLLFALPGSIGMLASAIYQFIDAIFVSAALGPIAFAAVNLAFPFVVASYSISDLIAVGSSVLISIKLGRKEKKEADRLFTDAVIMILIVTNILGISIGASAKWLISLMGAEGELLNMASNYLRIYSVFLPLCSYFFAFDNYLRICGKAKTSMAINVISSFLVIGFEALFLFVFRLGIWAAALAACLAFTFGSIASGLPFFLKKLELRFVKPHFVKSEILAVGKNGFPIFLTNIAGRITALVFNYLLLSMGGEDAVNAYGVLMYVDGFLISILYGMCDAVQPAIGYNYGAGEYARTKKLGALCFGASAIVCLIGFAVFAFLPGPVSSLFLNSSTTESIQLASGALFIFAFSYLLRWVSYAGQSYSAALERPFASLVISMAHNIVFPLTLAACFYSLGLLGIWINFPVTSLLAAIVVLFLFYYMFKKKRLLSPKHEEDERPYLS